MCILNINAPEYRFINQLATYRANIGNICNEIIYVAGDKIIFKLRKAAIC